MRRLRGDLEWITARAIEKEPERRYSTVSELAADVQRHLAHEPVLAGPPDLGYRLRKLAHRHRGFAAAALVALSAISIGGLLATNAGGVNVLRYGNARDLCLGIEAVMANGNVLHGLKRVVKDNMGYDLRHLMVASEGTLGVVVEVTVRLTDPPPPTRTMMLGLPAFDAVMRVFDALRGRLRLEAFEFLFSCELELRRLGARA